MIFTKFAGNKITLSFINTLSGVAFLSLFTKKLALLSLLSLKNDKTSAPKAKLEASSC